ncbi:MAG: hypothetical protein RQ745_08390 [Longimicrobiales bacterium]|nr:hypothetical protein [Longimicrobiales bacterium]
MGTLFNFMNPFREGDEPEGVRGEQGPGLRMRRSLGTRFPEVNPLADLTLTFHRTLRIPEDGRDWPLPAGLGQFPIVEVQDLGAGAPRHWKEQGGVAIPMYQSEAMWISFVSHIGYPFAVKVLAGGIDAVSGEDWQKGLRSDPRNYLTVPEQPWLDGFCVEKGKVRQFVAARLGEGRTVEERLTGRAETGGLQIVVTPMKADVWERLRRERDARADQRYGGLHYCAESTPEMGLGAGGSIRQEVYEDPHGLDVWDQTATRSCFVRIVQAQRWKDLTGHPVPHPPISRDAYLTAGIPWFEYFDPDLRVVHGGERFAQLAGLDDAPLSGGWEEEG